ncbi:MAG: type-F conjugative transfer system pilin assembly protein TrbC [Pseudomonadota bacterium]
MSSRNRRSLLRIGGIITGASAVLIANAQEAPPIDQEKIDQAIEDISPDVSAFAAEVAARAEAYSEEARTLTDGVMSRLGRDADVGDTEIDAVLALAPQISEARDAAATASVGIMVFASFSMDSQALRSLVVDAHHAGVPVMLRGFSEGSLAMTARRMRDLLGEIESEEGLHAEFLGGVVIDPRAYRIFNITDVPTFIALNGPLPDCDGLDCSAPPPPHDRLAGNMSLNAALSALASEGSEAPLQARAALTKLEARYD